MYLTCLNAFAWRLLFLNLLLLQFFLLLLMVVVALINLFHTAVAEIDLGVTDFFGIVSDLDNDVIRYALLRVQAEAVLCRNP